MNPRFLIHNNPNTDGIRKAARERLLGEMLGGVSDPLGGGWKVRGRSWGRQRAAAISLSFAVLAPDALDCAAAHARMRALLHGCSSLIVPRRAAPGSACLLVQTRTKPLTF